MKIENLRRAQDIVGMRTTLLTQIKQVEDGPGCIDIMIARSSPPIYVGRALAPSLIHILKAEIAKFEIELVELGAEVVPAFPPANPSSSQVEVASSPAPVDEKAPNAGPERRIWWLAWVYEGNLDVKHFETRKQRNSEAAGILKENWTADITRSHDDPPFLDDDQWINAWNNHDYSYSADLTHLEVGYYPAA